MRHLLLFISVFMTTTQSDAVINKKNVNKASSILYITNYTSSSTINSFTITYSNTWHNPMSQTISTYIPPNTTVSFNFGNISENVSIALHLSNSTSGSLQATNVEIYNCPWLSCAQFTNSNNPQTYFYFYGATYLTIHNYSACFC